MHVDPETHIATPREVLSAFYAVIRDDDNNTNRGGNIIPYRVFGLLNEAIRRANAGEFK